MLHLNSVVEYDALLRSELSGVVIHFGASWCSPCAELNAYLEETWVKPLSGKVSFLYVDAEKFEELCEKEGVDSVPHVLFFRRSSAGQEKVAEVSGARVKEIEQNVLSLFDGRQSFSTMEEFIKHIITRDRIVVLITGTPSRPRCGFTRKICDLLDQLGARYTFYDVMSDDDVCQAIKVWSGWPTFPQVYVGGKLIGGCDVCLQMHEEGELKSALGL